jgi:hypothetical protein
MTDQPSTAEGTGLVPAARLEPNAIGVAQDTVIGMASSAPAGGLCGRPRQRMARAGLASQVCHSGR